MKQLKILVANKFYYYRGGDCTYSISLEKLLQEKGHKVAFFSMQHPSNIVSEWNQYFPSQVDFSTTCLKEKLIASIRLLHSNEIKNKFTKLIDEFRPDVLHLNNIHSQLSPYIGEIAHKKGIKVVWTLHDYKLVCPAYSCLRDGKTCELCIPNSTHNVLYHKCMKRSLPASLLAYMESLVWSKKKLITNTDTFITPSLFMKQIMIKGGFPDSKIQVLPNFTNREYLMHSFEKGNYYCYIGRLSEEKGLNTLIKVASDLPYKLIIIGTGPLEKTLAHNNKNIKFVGFKNWEEIKTIVSQARFSVLPSEWYENNPLSIIESLCMGTPVLGANIGGIPELIDNTNGTLFKSGVPCDLKEKIQIMYNKSFNYSDICTAAQMKYSADNYYNKILEIYE
ncbi:glycosyltransferase [Parabacteroides goldsteinii]|uniref:glycosyltransferase n=1 Tax=Parabacteroides goldsteinii TaxID=328812 RepID=UPI003992922D